MWPGFWPNLQYKFSVYTSLLTSWIVIKHSSDNLQAKPDNTWLYLQFYTWVYIALSSCKISCVGCKWSAEHYGKIIELLATRAALLEPLFHYRYHQWTMSVQHGHVESTAIGAFFRLPATPIPLVHTLFFCWGGRLVCERWGGAWPNLNTCCIAPALPGPMNWWLHMKRNVQIANISNYF